MQLNFIWNIYALTLRYTSKKLSSGEGEAPILRVTLCQTGLYLTVFYYNKVIEQGLTHNERIIVMLPSVMVSKII